MLGGAGLLAACSPTPSASGEDVTLTFWTPGGSDEYCEGFNVISQNYAELNANVTMGEVQCNPTGEDYNEVLFANIAAGNPPDTTIVWSNPASYAVRSALLPLDDYMAASENSGVANWSEGVLASCRYDGQIFGLPAAAAPYAMYYNVDLFEEKGISAAREDFPKTWDELRRLSKEFTRWNGDILEQAGFIPWRGPGDFFSGAVEWIIWAGANGGQAYDAENQKYDINSEQNIEMMHFALDWWEEEYHGDIVAVQASGNWAAYPDGEGRPAAFSEGNYAIHSNGYWIATDIYGDDVKIKSWNAAPYPVGPSGTNATSGYWPNWVVIPEGSPNPDESFKFLDYLVVEGMKTWYSIVPDLPANKKFPTDFVPQRLIDIVGDDQANDINSFMLNQLNDAVSMWNSPVEDFYLDQLSRALEQIISKVTSPEDALGEAQRACQAELDRVLSS
jgi:ABC-type glycerol-3-phosphate transport system substrate-binding protein